MTCHFCGRGGKGGWVNAGGDVGLVHWRCFVAADVQDEALASEFDPLMACIPDLERAPVQFGQPGWFAYAVAMRRRGVFYRDIALKTGCSTSAAYKHLRHQKLEAA